MPRIFISYRRADSKEFTDRIYERLARDFGERNIFQDVEPHSIPAGADFRRALQDAVAECDVILVMIGPRWVDMREYDDPQMRRLDNENDYVRIEVKAGLEREERDQILVIPVLVGGAQMPGEKDLPDALKPLAFHNAQLVQGNPYFDVDMKRLTNRIKSHVNKKRSLNPLKSQGWLVGIMAVLVLIAAIVLLANGVFQPPAPATFDPEGTAIALLTATSTANAEASVNAIMTSIFYQTATARVPTLTLTPKPTDLPTNTPLPTPNATATTQAEQTLVAQETLDGAATNAYLETLRAPTYTPNPSDTPIPTDRPTSTRTPVPTTTYTPTPNQTLTAIAQATSAEQIRRDAEATVTADAATQAVIRATEVEKTRLTSVAQITKTAQLTATAAALQATQTEQAAQQAQAYLNATSTAVALGLTATANVTPVPTQTATQRPRPTATQDRTPCTVQTSSSGTEIRVGPGTSRSIRSSSTNETFEVAGKYTDDSSLVWYNIRVPGVTTELDRYWVSSEQITTQGNCATVAESPSSPVVQVIPTAVPGATAVVSLNGRWTLNIEADSADWRSSKAVLVTLSRDGSTLTLTSGSSGTSRQLTSTGANTYSGTYWINLKGYDMLISVTVISSNLMQGRLWADPACKCSNNYPISIKR